MAALDCSEVIGTSRSGNHAGSLANQRIHNAPPQAATRASDYGNPIRKL